VLHRPGGGFEVAVVGVIGYVSCEYGREGALFRRVAVVDGNVYSRNCIDL
jgi:hypothetical protein